MAKRKVNRRRRRAVATNPRRRRHVRRRRRNPVMARSITRRASNPRRHRRRHHRRRSNPSMAGVGSILRNAIYGAGGAVLGRVGYSLVSGFVPAGFGSSPFVKPLIKAGLGATVVKWAGTKFFGAAQGQMAALGCYVDAGLDLVNAFLPNAEGQITGIFRAPVQAALPPGQDTVSGFSDVEDVPLGSPAFAGLGDVEDVPQGFFA